MDEYLDFAKELAQEAGKIMKRYFLAKDIGTTIKDDDTPLTIADDLINDLVVKAVQESYPTHGVLGEEASFKPERDLIWVVDPIDGTVPFSIGIPVATFTLALVDRKNGQAKVGVIFDPFLNHLYYSAIGNGAHLNRTKIKVAEQESLKHGYVSVLGFKNRKLAPGIDALYAQNARVLSLISQAYSAAMVASGKLLGSIFAYGAPWDNAAASLIVREAGGVVTDLDGKPRRFDEDANGTILSCNQAIHNKLVKMIAE